MSINDNIYHIFDHILYEYNTIDHITNRCNFDEDLKRFLDSCNKYNIKVINKTDGKYNIFTKEHILFQLYKLKKEMIIFHSKMLNELANNNEDVSIMDYEIIINKKDKILNYMKTMDGLINLTEIVYNNNLLKLDNYSNVLANVLYENYVNFHHPKKKISDNKYLFPLENLFIITSYLMVVFIQSKSFLFF